MVSGGAVPSADEATALADGAAFSTGEEEFEQAEQLATATSAHARATRWAFGPVRPRIVVSTRSHP